MVACFICLLNSFIDNLLKHANTPEQRITFIWSDNKYFLIALIIFIVEVVIIFAMTIHHYYIKVPLELTQKILAEEKNF